MSFESFPKPEQEKDEPAEKGPEIEQKEYQAMIDREISSRLKDRREEVERALSEISSEDLADETKLLAEKELKNNTPKDQWGKMTFKETEKMAADLLGYIDNIDRLTEQAMRNLLERKMAQQKEYVEKLRGDREEEARKGYERHFPKF